MKLLPLICFMGLIASAQGLRPRSDVSDYRANAERDGIGIGADIMDAEQARHAFATGVYKGYVVVEVAVFPEPGKSVDLSPVDFSLRLAGQPSPIRPSSARTIASVLHRQANKPPAKPSDIVVYPTVGIGYESGTAATIRYTAEHGAEVGIPTQEWAFQRGSERGKLSGACFYGPGSEHDGSGTRRQGTARRCHLESSFRLSLLSLAGKSEALGRNFTRVSRQYDENGPSVSCPREA